MNVQSIQNNTLSKGYNTKSVNGSSDFSSCLTTTQSLEDIFEEASKKYGVSKNLLKAIAKAESDFNPNATSKSGAQGVMQLMPATAAELGVTDAYDPYQNIMGGSKYISQLLDRYDGDVTLALAAYNAGYGNVNKYGGVPPFKETQNYVVKVTSYMGEEYDLSGINYNTSGGKTQAASVSDSTNTSGSHGLVYFPYNPVYSANQEIIQQNQDIMDKLFSYNDYLDFIDLYMKMQELQSKQKEEDKKENTNERNVSYEQISYNPALLNLLEKTKEV